MAEQIRQAPRAKAPISRHPLFPAIIALWFGAAFGLGSLAVRPSLLEEIVLAAHIDTLVPAAAPPLGMTTRILLALTMALIGGLIGGSIARRIARPKPEVRQRRRNAANVDAIRPAYASSGYQDDGEEVEDEVLSAPSNKRRSLAIAHEDRPLELHDYAPLPGGPPQILNLADVAADPIRAGREEAKAALATETEPQAPVMRELPAAPEASGPLEAIARLEQTFGAPSATAGGRFGPPSEDAGHRSFDRPGSFGAPAPSALPATPAPAARAFAAPDQSAPFAAPEPDTEPEAEDFLPEPTADLRESIGLEAHQPLFPARASASDAHPAEAAAIDPGSAAAPATDVADVQPEPVPTAKPAFAPPGGAAAQRISAAELNTLSPVQLVERLALSIQRRRDHAAVTAEATVPTVVAEAIAEEAATAVPAPPPVPLAFAPPIPTPAPALAVEPLESADRAPTDEVVPAPMAMPKALRPVAFDDDDDMDLAAFLPPRQIGGPSAPVAALTASPVEAVSETMPEAEATSDAVTETDDEARVLEDGYSSLLDLSRPGPVRQQFVRVEEPVDSDAPVEPVVMFPGQTARPAFAPPPVEVRPAPAAAAPTPPPANGFRRFDSPPSGAVSAQPAARQDPEEAEQALRAALATLQRMSAAS